MTKLLKDIYYMRLGWGYMQFGHPWLFWHECTDKHNLIDGHHIQWSGKCSKCDKFILPYSKLLIMASLKELTE